MKVTEFLFQKGNFISLYGESSSGKTSLLLHVINEIIPSIYISTEGVSYQSRVEKTRWKKEVHFINVNSIYELLLAIVRSSKLNPKVIAVDTINSIYRLTKKDKDLEYPLILLFSLSRENNIKVILSWQVTDFNKVSGEKFMRKFSDEVLRVTRNHVILGNLRVCKFKIKPQGVEGCL